MANETKLVKFNFNGDEIDIVPMADGDVGLVLKRLCETIPVDDEGQRQRLARLASTGVKWATTFMIQVVAEDGQIREMRVLPRRSLPMWAATIDVSRLPPSVRESIKKKLVAYQDECAEVLARHFIDGQRAPAIDASAIIEQITAKVRDSMRADIAAVIGNMRPATRPKFLQAGFWDGPKHAPLIDAWDAVAFELDPDARSMTVADALAATAQDTRARSRARMQLHEQFDRFLARDGFDSDVIRLGKLLRQVALRPPVQGRALCRLGSGNVARWGVRLVEPARKAG